MPSFLSIRTMRLLRHLLHVKPSMQVAQERPHIVVATCAAYAGGLQYACPSVHDTEVPTRRRERTAYERSPSRPRLGFVRTRGECER